MKRRTAPTSAEETAERRRLGIGHWMRGQASVGRTQGLVILLWCSVLVAPLLSVFALARPAPAAPEVKVPGSTTGPEGFASLFVATWLRSSPDQSVDNLAAFFPGELDSKTPFIDPNSPPPAVDVHQVSAVGVDEVFVGYWTVTVGADVSDGAVRSTRYFAVPVARVTGRYVAVSLPAPTAPPLGDVLIPAVALGPFEPPNPTNSIAAAVTRFLGAKLTGQGDITTFSSPGSNLRPIKPAPYVSIELLTLGSATVDRANKVVEVSGSVSATDNLQHNWTIAYSLELTQRDERWEVSTERGGPTLSSNQPDLTPPTPAPRVAPVVTTTPPTTAFRPTTTTR